MRRCRGPSMKVIALVDGEHYPAVTRWGLATALSMGHEVLGAVFLGGTEKIGSEIPDFGIDVVDGRDDAMAALGDAIERFQPEGVLDLSDEPVLDYRRRMELAAVALVRG